MLDNTPQIWSSFLPWLATAIDLAQIPPSRILVHHACPLRQDIAELCTRIGVATRAVEQFDAKSPHSNKIRQLETDFGVASQIVLTDVDVVFTGLLPWEEIATPVAGKLVDLPKPSMEILEEVFAYAGITKPEQCTNQFMRGNSRSEFKTFVGNFNGGLYLIRSEHALMLGKRWGYWARWLLENIGILGRYRVHVDQVSFCLALKDCSLDSSTLGNEWNFPTHIEMPPTEQEPYLIHHHVRLDDHQRLLTISEDAPRRAIERVNRTIEAFQRRYFDNRTFWNHRYAHHPERGSGIGSRGETLALKRDVLFRVIPEDAGLSILDWGCGDLELVKGFPWKAYTGVDVSTEALSIAQKKRRDWVFATPQQFDADDGSARDLVLCIDVLIHQPTLETYRTLVDRMVALANIGLLVTGYDRDPDIASHITYFHEPLRTTLTARNDLTFVLWLGEYRDTSTYFVAKRIVNFVPSDDAASNDRLTEPCAAAREFIRMSRVTAG